MIIAIDGPAASGKGTLAKRLAAHFGLPHLDTGLLYRAVARAAHRPRRRRSTDAAAATRRGADARPRPLSTRPRLRGARDGRGRLGRLGLSSRCARRCSTLQRRFAAPARRRRARRARHRHGRLPGRRREALRHRGARGAGPAPPSRAAAAAARARDYESILADIRRRDAARHAAAPPRPCRPAEDAVDPRHHRAWTPTAPSAARPRHRRGAGARPWSPP